MNRIVEGLRGLRDVLKRGEHLGTHFKITHRRVIRYCSECGEELTYEKPEPDVDFKGGYMCVNGHSEEMEFEDDDR